MPTEMQTVTTTADYRVAASDQLTFTNQPAFLLSQPIVSGHWASPSPHLWISGEVDVVMTSASASGGAGMDGIVISNTFDSSPSVTVDPGATLKLSVTGGSAIGYLGGGSAAPAFDNAGTVVVSADGKAVGLLNWTSGGLLTNSGQVTVTSTTSDAIGLQTQLYGVQVVNSGQVTVTGHGQVIGVDMGAAGTAQVFHNTGTIIAHDDSATAISVGVFWDNGPQPGAEGSFVNDGTIEADRAVDVEITYGTAAENLIVNNGHMIGDVWLSGGGAETFVNNGDVTGAIDLIGAGSLYDGRLGTVGGPITVHNLGGDTLLGGAGRETITGAPGNDSISGGAGGDVMDGGDGRNTLFGGDGDDRITGGANFNQVNGNTGDDSIVGHSDSGDWLLGGQGRDSIDASGSYGANIVNGNLGNDTIIGGSGADTLRGGQGDDEIHVGPGDALVFGDLGDNIIYGGQGVDTFHGGAGHDVVHGWHVGDSVQVDLGVTVTTTQVTGGVHLNFSNGGEMWIVFS